MRARASSSITALAYVPLVLAAVYSSTKAALHSYKLSQRYKLQNTSVSVIEIAPPWVQTDLLGSNNDPRAMPLAEFIEEKIRGLGADVNGVLVERAKPVRDNPGPNEGAFVTEFNDLMVQARVGAVLLWDATIKIRKIKWHD
jgi:uncharacterized oxidoreductase